jgi:PAS domain S-box-containing protein
MQALFSRPLKSRLRSRAAAAAAADRGLRVLVPDCQGGEASYAAAVAVIEACGGRWREARLRVVGTDGNQASLERARRGACAAERLRSVPQAVLARHFIRRGPRLVAADHLRKLCTFVLREEVSFAHTGFDVVFRPSSAAPPKAVWRRSTLRSLHAALVPGGLLVDGSALAASAPELFAPVRGARGLYCARPAARKAPRPVHATRETEAGFRALFLRSPDAMLVAEAAAGLILDANPAARRLYGLDLAGLRRQRVAELIAPADAVRRSHGERRSAERLSLPHHRRADGTMFPADVSRGPATVRGQASMLWIVRDATERLRARGAASESRRRLDDEAFMDEVVHELRAPVSVIRGFAETLRRGVRKSSDRADFLKSIESQTSRMGHIVDQLLNLSAAKSGARPAEKAAVPLSAAVWETAAAFEPIAKRRQIVVRVDVAHGLTAFADPSALPHLLGNLVDNAIKYNRRGGRVLIEGRESGKEALLSVTDTGAGVPAEDLTRIFERFFRSEHTRGTKGTGLGLAIVRAVAKANGGRVWAEQARGGGTTFHLALPLAPAAGAA